MVAEWGSTGTGTAAAVSAYHLPLMNDGDTQRTYRLPHGLHVGDELFITCGDRLFRTTFNGAIITPLVPMRPDGQPAAPPSGWLVVPPVEGEAVRVNEYDQMLAFAAGEADRCCHGKTECIACSLGAVLVATARSVTEQWKMPR